LPLANSLDLLATHDPDMDEENEEETPVYEKFDPLLHREHSRNKRSPVCICCDLDGRCRNTERPFYSYMMDIRTKFEGGTVLAYKIYIGMLSGGLLEAAY